MNIVTRCINRIRRNYYKRIVYRAKNVIDDYRSGKHTDILALKVAAMTGGDAARKMKQIKLD